MSLNWLKRKWVALSLLAVSAAAQAQGSVSSNALALPALGDGLEMSEGAERKLGDSIAREIYRDASYIDDPILGDYVNAIWQRLLAAARQRGELTPEMNDMYAWTLMLIRERSVNAFALPGGYMGVHLGLMATVSNADELASVLGHETSHITQRHIARMIGRQQQQAPLMIASLILGVLAAAHSPDAAGALILGGQAGAVQGQLNFSRDVEREADRVGYGVMTQAGFNGQGFVTMFQKLQDANRHNDTGDFPYLRNHPLTTERIADMQARQQLAPPYVSPLSPAQQQDMALTHAMLAARARVLADPSVDNLRAALTQAALGTLSMQPAAQQAGVLYAAALSASQLRDHAAAQKVWARLQGLVGANEHAVYEVRLLGAELALNAGGAADLVRAKALVEQAAPSDSQGPQGLPRALLLLRARVWMQAGGDGTARAAQALQVWLAGQPRDAQAWQLLSTAYAAQGQTLRAVRADAESQAAHLDYAAARDRFLAAQDLMRKDAAKGVPVDNIEASIIDTRSRQLEALWREQMKER